MSREEKHNIIIAETSPILSNGLTYCLRRLPGLQIHTIEVASYAELTDSLNRYNPKIIIVNPTFGGGFDPTQLRNSVNSDIKIVALEAGRLDKHTRTLYDDAISIVDDMTILSTTINRLLDDRQASNLEKETLSQREKEIIKLVVKGMTNKEIADKLFLSVYTVNTHRRNISRKLEIHSATGLTIYAIVNQLVDLSEIKL